MGLESVFGWIPELLGWIMGFLPHAARLHAHEGAVKISGKRYKELRHGFYFWIPHCSAIYTDNIKRKVIELPEQLLTTLDGVRVRAGGVLVYYISNVVTWLVENEDPEHGVRADAARVLREWVKAKDFEAVQAYSPEKRGEDDLTRLAQSELGTDFGVRVQLLALASFAASDAWDLHHSGLIDISQISTPEADE